MSEIFWVVDVSSCEGGEGTSCVREAAAYAELPAHCWRLLWAVPERA